MRLQSKRARGEKEWRAAPGRIEGALANAWTRELLAHRLLKGGSRANSWVMSAWRDRQKRFISRLRDPAAVVGSRRVGSVVAVPRAALHRPDVLDLGRRRSVGCPRGHCHRE